MASGLSSFLISPSANETADFVGLLLPWCSAAAIGVERQWHQRMAGLRTNALERWVPPFSYYSVSSWQGRRESMRHELRPTWYRASASLEPA
jgi:hypothetical protein